MQLQWPPEWAPVYIAPKELVPIVLAVANLCPLRQHGCGVRSQQEVSPRPGHLQAPAHSLPAVCNLRHYPCGSPPPGHREHGSRCPIQQQLISSHPPIPTIIPSALQALLLNPHISANSQTWTSLLSNTLQAASCSPLAQPTPWPSGDI